MKLHAGEREFDKIRPVLVHVVVSEAINKDDGVFENQTELVT